MHSIMERKAGARNRPVVKSVGDNDWAMQHVVSFHQKYAE